MKKLKILKAGNGAGKLIEALGLYAIDPIYIFVPTLQHSSYYEVELAVDDSTYNKIKEYIYINATAE